MSSPPGRRLSVVTLNVCGLTGAKLVQVMAWLREQEVHVGVLTETKTTADPNDLLRRQTGSGAFWPGVRFFHTPGTGHNGGVVAVFSPDCPLTEPTTYSVPLDTTGRVIRIDAFLDAAPFRLVGVYAPAQPTGRGSFFSSTLASYLPNDPTPTVIAGDFNVTLHQADRVSCPVPGVHTGASELQSLMASAHLCDVWRELNPTAMAFTHWSAPTSSGKRLDRFLVSDSISPALDTAASPATAAFQATSDILPSAPIVTDHLPVSLTVTCASSGARRGKGIIGFPIRLLNSKEPVAIMTAFIDRTVPRLMALPPSKLIVAYVAWKAEFLSMAIAVDKLYRRNRQKPARDADHCARIALEGMLAAAAAGVDVDAAAIIWLAQKENAAEAWRALFEPARIVAATLDQLKGDTSSFYYHQQAREFFDTTTLVSLNKPGRSSIDPPQPKSLLVPEEAPQALQYVVDFYSSGSPVGLFRPHPGTDPAAQDTLLSSLPRRLNGPLADLAEGVNCADDALAGMLSGEELQLALAHAARGTVPGDDGIPYEVYRFWRGALSPLLLLVFNTGFGEAGRTSPAPLAPLLSGVICLLFKPGKAREELESYRPITLLNADAKLIMSIIANRLQVPLDYLIDIGQGAFIHGRDISHNVRYHLALAARFRDLGLPGWLMHSDLTKAYDTVDRGWLDRVMISMGFHPKGVVRWCQILLAGANVRARVNGFLTDSFPMTSGIFQGSALSCMEWVIVLQPMMSYLSSLRSEGTLSTPTLPGPDGVGVGLHAEPAQAFADDVTLVTSCPESDIKVLQSALALSRLAGNPAESIGKFFLTHLHGPIPVELRFEAGARERHVATGYPLRDTSDALSRHLGVPIAPGSPDAVVTAAYGTMAGAMLAATRRWDGIAPSLIGRAHVAGQCIASKLVYQAGFTMTALAILRPMQQVINRWVAASARAEEVTPNAGCLYPCAAVSRLPRGMGGIGLPDLESHAMAMRAKPIWQLFGFNSHPWAALYASEVAKPAVTVPYLPPGPLWVVAQPAAASGLGTAATPIVREGVQAFKQLGITRIVPVDCLPFESIMREATFGNDAAPDVNYAGLSSDTARQWLRLSDVRGAWLWRNTLSAEALADVNCIIAALPPAWRTALQLDTTPTAPWSRVDSDVTTGWPVLRGPDPMAEEDAGPAALRRWLVWPSGRLHPLPGAAGLPGEAAMVVVRPKPRRRWIRTDYVFYDDQLAKPNPDDHIAVTEPWMVGVWSSMQLDPTAWGIPSLPGFSEVSVALLDMSVRVARRHLRLLTAVSEDRGPGSRLFGVKSAGAVFPPAWRLPGTDAIDATALRNRQAFPTVQLDRHGLIGRDERWRRTLELVRSGFQADEVDSPAAWVRGVQSGAGPSAPRRPNRMQTQRAEDEAAAQAQPPPGGVPVDDPDLPDGFARVWVRLLDPTIQRPFAITAWRILHCCLGCNAFIAAKRLVPDDAPVDVNGDPDVSTACCGAPCCASLSDPPFETLAHTFLDCPAARPAMQWLCDTWTALSGGAPPPLTAAVLLADDLSGWAGAPEAQSQKKLLRAWTRLRVAVIGAIWRVRCDRCAGGLRGVSLARRAVLLALDSITGAIRRDWQRTEEDITMVDDGFFCVNWWRGFDAERDKEWFFDQWASPPTLCKVLAVPVSAGEDPIYTLNIRVGVEGQIPLPL
jgi:exonuclease III